MLAFSRLLLINCHETYLISVLAFPRLLLINCHETYLMAFLFFAISITSIAVIMIVITLSAMFLADNGWCLGVGGRLLVRLSSTAHRIEMLGRLGGNCNVGWRSEGLLAAKSLACPQNRKEQQLRKMAEVLRQILREDGNSSSVLSLSLQAIAAEHIHAVDAHRQHQHVLCDPQLHQNLSSSITGTKKGSNFPR